MHKTLPKQPKVTGAISEVWARESANALRKKYRIADISEVQTGPFGSQLHQADYVENGTPIITVEHLGDNRILHNDLPMVTDADKKRLCRYLLKEGDIVFSRVGSVDRRAYVGKGEAGWLFSGRCLRVRVNSSGIDSRWLSYYFGLPAFKEYIRGIAVGATMPSLNTTLLSDIEIEAPSFSEQCAIAKILSDLDEKIELNHRMNKTLEAIAQAFFKRWFVDFNFPDEKGRPYKDSGDRMVDSELGEIPEGWKAGRFSDFVSNMMEPLRPGEEICDRKYVPIESLPMKQVGMIDDKSYLEAQSSLVAFEKNDILFGAMRAYFHRVNFSPYKGVTRTTTFVLRPHKLSYLSYGLFLLNLESSVHYANLHSKGSTMPYAVWENSLSEMPAVIPDESVLAMYHRIIYPLLQRISELSDENKTLAKIRDALLPKLMSGKIRMGSQSWKGYQNG